ncbi:MAG: CBS domain-containing protein [Cyclobacteriaceae bacterium]|nr:CBS domain-containing protein [Cyclobacteriaceae bacterium]
MKTLVSEIMTTDLVTVDIDTPLRKIVTMFRKHKVRHFPVVDGGKLKGIVSLSDILRLSFGMRLGDDEVDIDEAIFEMLKLDQVMATNVKTVTPDQMVADVARFLTQQEFHALPVVDKDELVGIITTTDVIHFLLLQTEKSAGEAAVA